MRDLCLDEATLQSFCDGELETKMLEQVRLHLATCVVCEEAARQVESEMELATGAFAAELALSVPSERLRVRLDEAIAGLNGQPHLRDENATSRLRNWLTSFASTFNLSPQHAIGFASVLIFLVLAAVVGGILLRQRGPNTGLELVAGNKEVPSDLVFLEKNDDTSTVVTDKSDTAMPTRRTHRIRSVGSVSDDQPRAAHALKGEKNYLQAISLLTEAIEVNGESSLKPSLLADYKRNLEVVNQAIVVTQHTARTNRNDPDAAEMLFAVYQSKLDLLSAVAEQSRPMIAQR